MWFLLPLAGLVVLGSIGYAGHSAYGIGREMVEEILANREPLPAWLEAVAPLKGRWLRLLLGTPWISLHVMFVFAIYLAAPLAVAGFAIGAACWVIGH